MAHTSMYLHVLKSFANPSTLYCKNGSCISGEGRELIRNNEMNVDEGCLSQGKRNTGKL